MPKADDAQAMLLNGCVGWLSQQQPPPPRFARNMGKTNDPGDRAGKLQGLLNPGASLQSSRDLRGTGGVDHL